MEHLEYRTVISAPAKKVWEKMLRQETYRQWAGKSWPGSYYQGTWEKGEKIKFIGPDGSGTLAEIVDIKPYERAIAVHIAVLQKGGTEDRISKEAKGWIGTMEEYKFAEKNGKTTLSVSIQTTPEWRKMFDDSWPQALDELKKICEGQLTEA